jgi:excisionase family DNA binding protein
LTTHDPTLLTIDDVSSRWQVPPRHVRERVQKRELPVLRIGKLIRFRPTDIAEYEAARFSPAMSGPLARS